MALLTNNLKTMDENKVQEDNNTPKTLEAGKFKSQSQMAGAIVIAGLLIAGAILIKGNGNSNTTSPENALPSITLAPVTSADRSLGSPTAKLKLVMYEDFQCPFCGRFVQDAETSIRNTYVTAGTVELVYRDFAFLGQESNQAALAAMCANDQGKFWDYHDYLFSHQNGEDQGAFADPNLKTFAKTLGLDTTAFNTCFDSGKYTQAVAHSKTGGVSVGVSGTPKGFIIADKNISTSTQNEIIKALNIPPGQTPPVSFYAQKNIISLDGALPSSMVKSIIDILLKQ